MISADHAAQIKGHHLLRILWLTSKCQGHPRFKGKGIQFLLLVGGWYGYIIEKHSEYRARLQSSFKHTIPGSKEYFLMCSVWDVLYFPTKKIGVFFTFFFF